MWRFLYLLVVVLPLALAVRFVSQSAWVCLVIGSVFWVAGICLVHQISGWRHRRMLRAWAVRQGLADLHLRRVGSEAFINRGGIPWWLDLELYELRGTTNEGQRKNFHVSVTGALGCLISLRLDASDAEEWLRFDGDGNVIDG
jgi:hypothetical protein